VHDVLTRLRKEQEQNENQIKEPLLLVREVFGLLYFGRVCHAALFVAKFLKLSIHLF